MDADAQFDIEHDLAIFDEDVAIALGAIDGARPGGGGRSIRKDRRKIGDGAGRG
jgi:hypothetical protein